METNLFQLHFDPPIDSAATDRIHPAIYGIPTPTEHAPAMRMNKTVVRRIMLTIGAQSPETGGILLGPIGGDDITDYYYDERARCGPTTYSPDHKRLSKKMREVWIPSGLDMKGFVHAHPAGVDCLSTGDLDYIRRLLVNNPDMGVFAAPIILPAEFRICPFVVLRDDPSRPRRVRLVLL